MRIAIDIDSTLHHHWDELAEAAKRRFGIELPYAEQLDWGITRLKPRQLEACVEQTHSDAAIARARPYPGAVAAVRRWHEAGHAIHVMSHRSDRCHAATTRWLAEIGLPFAELHCSWDKVARCRALGIELLIDDSPLNIEGALEAGIAAATLSHPWNAEVCEVEDVVCASSWAELEQRLAPLLAPQPAH